MGAIYAAQRGKGAQWIANDQRSPGSPLRSQVMKKRTKRLLGGLALTAGALGAVSAYLSRKKNVVTSKKRSATSRGDVWARPGMSVTFRAELMPGRDREERTFRVMELLPSGRVLLDRAAGEHAENEFERSR
jgi:hypothetical protein